MLPNKVGQNNYKYTLTIYHFTLPWKVKNLLEVLT